ncbi:ribonuclease H-like domain-containing protein, partial [Tanacetum coccineum]
VKGTASSSLSSQNFAFVSSTSSTNEVNTAYGVSTANTQISTASTQKTSRKITINGSDTAGYDKSKVECFNCHMLRHFTRECRGPRNQDNMSKNQDNSRRTINVEEISCKAMLAIDGADSEISVLKSELEKLKQEKESNQLKIENFDNASKSLDKLIGSQIPDKSIKGLGFVSYNVVPPPPTGLFSPLNLDLSNSSLEEFQQPEFEGYGPKTSKSVSEDTSNEIRESPDASLVEELVSNDKLEKKTVFPTVAKINFVRPQQQEKPVRKPVKLTAITIKGKGWNIVSRAVLMKTGLRPLNTARPMCDKKNSVLFTDTGCFVLSPDFKLADESQVLLNVPSKNNMYSIDMKNIVPKESLTYLVAKATFDESMLWHRRLEFKNRVMSEFYEKKGIKMEFSVARTPQQNSVVERRNRTLIEAARTMLADSKLPTTFWAEAVNTACYV